MRVAAVVCALASCASAFVRPRATRFRAAAARAAAADDRIAELFAPGTVDPAAVAAACADDVVWDDRSRRTPVEGRDAVRLYLEKKWRRGHLVVERVAEAGDGPDLAGFSWRRTTADGGKNGLRGVTIIECDASGLISNVVEGAEPLLKPGKLVADLFAKAVAGLEKVITRTYEPRTPDGAGDLVRYIWQEAYPSGAPPSVFADLCDENVVYEDTNYRRPHQGKAEVTKLGEEYDLGGVEWVLTKATSGKSACAFRWEVKLKGEVVADGISLLEGVPIKYLRDVPSPLSKPIWSSLAARLRPALRTFRSRSVVY